MSTPTGRPDRPASAFDYAPKRVREQWSRDDTNDAADGGPANDPPRDRDEDEPPRTEHDDEDDRSSLVPRGPHETPRSDWDDAEDDRTERWDDEPEHRSADDGHAETDGGDDALDAHLDTQQEGGEEEQSSDPYDEHLERLAATLRSLQRDNDAAPPERSDARQARPARGSFAADASGREVYIDGTRLPRFLQSSYVPPPRERGSGLVGAMLAVGIASMVAAPLAYYVAFGNPFASAPRAIQAKPELRYTVASTSTSLPGSEQQAAPIANTVAPIAPIVRAESLPAAQRLTAVRPLEPQPQSTASVQAPRPVPLTHVLRWPDTAQDSGATQPPWTANAAPVAEQPRVDAAPAPVPNASAYAMAAAPPPVAAPPQPVLPRPPVRDAEDIQLLLKQGQDFIAAGDFATARVVLRRAAEAGAAAAALALGQTYDPKALAKMRARGVVPDAEEARRWYETAQKLGSGEAAQRLERLARDE